MKRTLVHIVNEELLKRYKHVQALGFDMDGNFTDLHNPFIYNLVWKTVVRFLKDGSMKDQLRHLSFTHIAREGHIPLGWFLDMQLGYLIHTNIEGKIMGVRDGRLPLSRDKILKTYKTGSIEIPQIPNPDFNKPRFLLICDGFDYAEAYMKSVIPKSRPRESTVRAIDDAIFQAHHHEDGYKKELREKPHLFGIRYNERLVELFDRLSQRYVLFLVTSSPEEYTNWILDMLGIREYFQIIKAGAIKPYCFRTPSESNGLWRELNSLGVEKPKNVFYMGDHLLKDVISTSKLGFLTGLRMRREDIITVERKLRKYGGIQFRQDGSLRIRSTGANNKAVSDLGIYLMQIYRYAGLLSPKVQYLEEVFH